MRKRGELDSLPALCSFADKLEKAVLATISDGIMTGDLAAISTLSNKQTVDTETFLDEIGIRLERLLNQ